MVSQIFCEGPARNRGAAGPDSGGAPSEHRCPITEAGVRKVIVAVCDYAGAEPGFGSASGAGGNVGAGIRGAAVPVPADFAVMMEKSAPVGSALTGAGQS